MKNHSVDSLQNTGYETFCTGIACIETVFETYHKPNNARTSLRVCLSICTKGVFTNVTVNSIFLNCYIFVLNTGCLIRWLISFHFNKADY